MGRVRQREVFSLPLQVEPGCLAGHGIHPLPIRLHIQKGMAKHAVHVVHGVDVPLHRSVFKRIEGLFIGHHRGSVDGRGPPVVPGDAGAVYGHGARDDVTQRLRRLGQPCVCRFVGVSGIEHVHRHHRGQAGRIGGQGLQGCSHNAPVPGVIRAEKIQSLLVDADDDDVGVRHARLLEKLILNLPVQAMKQPQPNQPGDHHGRGQSKQKVFSSVHVFPHSLSAGPRRLIRSSLMYPKKNRTRG